MKSKWKKKEKVRKLKRTKASVKAAQWNRWMNQTTIYSPYRRYSRTCSRLLLLLSGLKAKITELISFAQSLSVSINKNLCTNCCWLAGKWAWLAINIINKLMKTRGCQRDHLFITNEKFRTREIPSYFSLFIDINLCFFFFYIGKSIGCHVPFKFRLPGSFAPMMSVRCYMQHHGC